MPGQRSRELQTVTERPNTEPKQTKRQRQRETEGRRERERGRGGREILTAEGNTAAEEKCFFFFRPARERG